MTPLTSTELKRSSIGLPPRPPALFVIDPAYVDLIYGPPERRELERLADCHPAVLSRSCLSNDYSILKNIEVIFSGWGAHPLDEALLAAAPNLKAVFHGGGSVKRVVTPAFWRRDIAITCAADANSVPVAEFVQAVTVLSLKNFWSLAAPGKHCGGWTPVRNSAGGYRSTVGFIGFGRIARKTLDILRFLESSRLVYSVPSPSEADARLYNFEVCSLDEIFSRSDVVSLHLPDLPGTKGLINGRHFEQMKSGATFINTARGAIVNETEMIDSLLRRTDITAILDVTDPEPPTPESLLWKMPNVVLTPHIAGSVGRECIRMGASILAEFRRYLDGEPLQWQVSEESLAFTA